MNYDFKKKETVKCCLFLYNFFCWRERLARDMYRINYKLRSKKMCSQGNVLARQGVLLFFAFFYEYFFTFLIFTSQNIYICFLYN